MKLLERAHLDGVSTVWLTFVAVSHDQKCLIKYANEIADQEKRPLSLYYGKDYPDDWEGDGGYHNDGVLVKFRIRDIELKEAEEI